MNGFDEFPPVEIKTQALVKLLVDWEAFLLKYENGHIPGLTKIA
jgi:hypothetical protein